MLIKSENTTRKSDKSHVKMKNKSSFAERGFQDAMRDQVKPVSRRPRGEPVVMSLTRGLVSQWIQGNQWCQ